MVYFDPSANTSLMFTDLYARVQGDVYRLPSVGGVIVKIMLEVGLEEAE